MDWNSLNNAQVLDEIGQRLKRQRINKKLTQQQLAVMAGVSMFTVAQIEKGNSVSLSMLIAVLRILRLLDNLDLLFTETIISPVAMLKQKRKVVQRVRPKKE